MSTDGRYALVLEQVNRALSQQIGSLEAVRSRAGTVVATSSIASSFLGAANLRDRALGGSALVLTILALISLAVVVLSTVTIILPYGWRTGFDGHRALTDYVEADPPASLEEMQRSFAYYMQSDLDSNTHKLNRLYRALQVSVVATGLEVAFWLLALLMK